MSLVVLARQRIADTCVIDSTIVLLCCAYSFTGESVALKSTVFKASLQVNDLDRHYYQTHALTLAQHPSENDERLMVRLLAFALHADEALEFGRGLSSEEPDLWRKDLTGQIELWIEIGQPDEQYLRRACGRARQVVVYTYSGGSAQVWWSKAQATLEQSKNLTVIDIASTSSKALAAMAQRAMDVQCLIQEQHIQMMTESDIVPIELTTRMSARR